MGDMAMVTQLGKLILLMLVLPILTGGFFCTRKNEMTRGNDRLIYMWVSGQFVLWTAFWIICVYGIFQEWFFLDVAYTFEMVSVTLAIMGGICDLCGQVRDKRKGLHLFQFSKEKKSHWIFWILFAGILLFQLIQAVRMTYADGDDAYYVAVSTIAVNSDTMYHKLPYTGGTTSVDIRHGLAPFPIWIAYLSAISGIRAVSVAHVAAPLMLIPMTYMIFYLLGKKLFAGKEQRIPLFLIFTELLVLFGDYSFYTVENFMIARNRQGKAALGSIVIPMLFMLMSVLMSKLEERKKCGLAFWGLLTCVMASGCLCSVMGAVLCCMLVGVAGVCAAVAYRRWLVLIPLVLCCVPCGICAALYMFKA